MTSVRLLCYNVRSLRDDARAVASVIRDQAADVAVIQEAPRFLRWRSKCAALARESGMVLVCGGRTTGANLVLSSMAVDVVSVRELSFSTYRNLHQRGAALAVLRKSGTVFAVAGTHLDLIEVPRLRHLDELQAAADAAVPAGAPVIVAGDMNAVPGSATWRRLEMFGDDAWAVAGEGDGSTYPSKDSVRRIDGVFVSSGAKVCSARLVDSEAVHRASDHKPLVVEFDL